MSSKNTHQTDEEIEAIAAVLKEAQAIEPQQENHQVDLSRLQLAYEESVEEITQLKDQLLRSVAESDNLRKRTAKQIDDAGKFAVNNFARDLVEVLENLYLATDNIPAEALEKDSIFSSILQGVEMTKTTLINIFEKHGIKRITPQAGDTFDPNLHQAVTQIAQPEFADNTIISAMRAGYILHDRLLKPSMVIVAKNTQK
jgi:molecular chaperone GrpE